MPQPIKIYVELQDEDVEVYRPVKAVWIADGIYELSRQHYDPSIERWRFCPGDRVVCKKQLLDGDRVLVAVELARGDQ